MLDPIPRDENRGKSSDGDRTSLRREALDIPSTFVASLVETLRKRGTEESTRCAEAIAKTSMVSGREFTAIVESLPHPTHTKELLWAYSFISKTVVDIDFAQGFPALIDLAHKVLTEPMLLDSVTATRVSRLINRVLDARLQSYGLADRLDSSLSDVDRSKLHNIVMRGVQDRSGYWTSVELLSALYPDAKSLEYVFRAVDRSYSQGYTKGAILGLQRAIAAAAGAHFNRSFEFVANALGAEARSGELAIRDTAAAGLAFHAEVAAVSLSNFLATRDEAKVLLACRVCILADNDERINLTRGQRSVLAEELRCLIDSYRQRSTSSPLKELCYRALAHISPEPEDVAAVGWIVRDGLARREVISSRLAHAYAEGLSRIESEGGLVAFRPLSDRTFNLLASRPPVVHDMMGRSKVQSAIDSDNVCESLALDIGGTGKFNEVVDLCRQQEHLLDPRMLVARSSGELSLFFDAGQTVLFTEHHARLAEEGPIEYAAILLPELLSALEYGRNTEDDVLAEMIGDNAIRSFAWLTKQMATDEHVRALAIARLSSSDWSRLSALHKINLKDFPRSYPDLGLTTFALRAVVEDDIGWRKGLISWWGKLDGAARDQMDVNALAFASVMGEKRIAGTVWDLLSRVSLVDEDANTFRDIAMGLLVRPQLSVQKICENVKSPLGNDLARAFLLAQLMCRHFTDEQRESVIVVARESLDELGVLALDAVATLGVISHSQEDASLLLSREPSLGVEESIVRVTYARSAARILRNIEQRAKKNAP